MSQAEIAARAAAAKQLKQERENNDWPVGLTGIALLCGLIGLIGLFGAGMGYFDLLVRGHVSDGLASPDEAEFKVFEEALRKYMPFRFFQEFLRTILAGAFLWGAFQLLAHKKNARTFLFAVCGWAIGFAVAGVILRLLMYSSVSSIIMETDGLLREYGDDRETMSAVVTGIALGIAFIALLGLAIKGAFYAMIMLYLTRPHIRAVFDEDPYPEFDGTPVEYQPIQRKATTLTDHFSANNDQHMMPT